jgi:dTDP-4-amino-4,6-dideoxygalactose transaminase
VEKIPITKMDFSGNELDYIRQVLDSGWVVQGPMVTAFEERVADISGVKHAVAVNSCTSALHLSLVALGIGPGDEVLVPSFTFVASANAVEQTGARPVFCDVELGTFNIDVKDARSRITKNTRAIMPVHQFGLCADMPEILDLAKKHGLFVVEDAACAIGSRIGDAASGSFGTTGCFSFHPKKLITSGEGGAITTDDDDLARLFRSLRDHGASMSDLARHGKKGSSFLPEYHRVGYNYRMTDLEGAVGRAQIERFDDILGMRLEAASRYDALFDGSDLFVIPGAPRGYLHTYQSYALIYHGGMGVDRISLDDVEELNRRRNEIMMKMEEMGVATRQGAQAVHILDFYRKTYGISPSDYPFSYMADRLSVSLPMYHHITEEEQKRVGEVLMTCAA